MIKIHDKAGRVIRTSINLRGILDHSRRSSDFADYHVLAKWTKARRAFKAAQIVWHGGKQNYFQQLQTMCARYGFTACPLTEREANALQTSGISVDGAYSVACDVASGFSFIDAVTAYQVSVQQ